MCSRSGTTRPIEEIGFVDTFVYICAVWHGDSVRLHMPAEVSVSLAFGKSRPGINRITTGFPTVLLPCHFRHI